MSLRLNQEDNVNSEHHATTTMLHRASEGLRGMNSVVLFVNNLQTALIFLK